VEENRGVLYNVFVRRGWRNPSKYTIRISCETRCESNKDLDTRRRSFELYL